MKFCGLISLIIWNTLMVVVNSIKTPVILMPGIGGSSVEGKLNKPSVLNEKCANKTDDYVLLWKNDDHICPVLCFIDNMRLYYNMTTRRTQNSVGVQTRMSSKIPFVQKDIDHPEDYYLGSLMKALEEHGYKRGVSLQTAPYDFRKGPHEIEEFWEELRNLVVNTYKENGNKRVTLIVHSMGGPMALTFLHQQTQEFKDKYINALISLAGAFGGSVKSTLVFIQSAFAKNMIQTTEDSWRDYQAACTGMKKIVDLIWGMSSKKLQAMAATYPTLYWLFPSSVAWNDSFAIVQTPEKNYSLANMEELFKDLNQMIPYEMYKDVHPYNLNFSAPGVDVHCLYGYNVSTVSSLEYTKGLSKNPKQVQGDGDGTVNLNSLQACRQWKDQPNHSFHEEGFINIDHMGIVAEKAPINYILKALGAM